MHSVHYLYTGTGTVSGPAIPRNIGTRWYVTNGGNDNVLLSVISVGDGTSDWMSGQLFSPPASQSQQLPALSVRFPSATM